MRFLSLALFLFSLCLTSTVASEPTETEIPGVTAELLELRQSDGVLRLAVRFANTSDVEVSGHAIRYADVVLLQARTKQKHFGLKDADGHFVAGPISDWSDGGRWWMKIPPRAEAVLWMLFEPLAPNSAVSVEIPGVFPFDDVLVAEGTGNVLAADAATSTPAGLRARLVSAKRADQELKVRLKIENLSAHPVDGVLLYRDVYVLDAVSKRKYPLLRDAEGNYVARPQSDAGDGGRYWLSEIASGGSALVSLTFAAPPDDVTRADLVLPGFLPFEGIELVGQGGAAQGGVAAAGRSLGLEAALKELRAEVSPKEIKIDLAADVLFDFDKAELKPSAEEQLRHLLTVVSAKPTARVAVTGHTDVRGDAAYNQALSERRAASVRQWLVAHGVAEGRITALGAGESRPLRDGDTEEDHRENRRVEIRIEE